jgi:hypothetical protein
MLLGERRRRTRERMTSKAGNSVHNEVCQSCRLECLNASNMAYGDEMDETLSASSIRGQVRVWCQPCTDNFANRVGLARPSGLLHTTEITAHYLSWPDYSICLLISLSPKPHTTHRLTPHERVFCSIINLDYTSDCLQRNCSFGFIEIHPVTRIQFICTAFKRFVYVRIIQSKAGVSECTTRSISHRLTHAACMP